jgi:hypothetical protein
VVDKAGLSVGAVVFELVVKACACVGETVWNIESKKDTSDEVGAAVVAESLGCMVSVIGTLVSEVLGVTVTSFVGAFDVSVTAGTEVSGTSMRVLTEGIVDGCSVLTNGCVDGWGSASVGVGESVGEKLGLVEGAFVYTGSSLLYLWTTATVSPMFQKSTTRRFITFGRSVGQKDRYISFENTVTKSDHHGLTHLVAIFRAEKISAVVESILEILCRVNKCCNLNVWETLLVCSKVV